MKLRRTYKNRNGDVYLILSHAYQMDRFICNLVHRKVPYNVISNVPNLRIISHKKLIAWNERKKLYTRIALKLKRL